MGDSFEITQIKNTDDCVIWEIKNTDNYVILKDKVNSITILNFYKVLENSSWFCLYRLAEKNTLVGCESKFSKPKLYAVHLSQIYDPMTV